MLGRRKVSLQTLFLTVRDALPVRIGWTDGLDGIIG